MKKSNSNEKAAAIFIIVLVCVFGLPQAWSVIQSLKTIGINLIEILAAKHLAFWITGGIMTFLSSMGFWVGKYGGRMLFATILFLLTGLL